MPDLNDVRMVKCKVNGGSALICSIDRGTGGLPPESEFDKVEMDGLFAFQEKGKSGITFIGGDRRSFPYLSFVCKTDGASLKCRGGQKWVVPPPNPRWKGLFR